MSENTSDAFRWQSFFQHAAQPIFLLNRRRRILFVNRAWEECTGLMLADVRGRACRRRAASAAQERDESILTTCAPPADATEGRMCQVRRRAPGRAIWWEMQFVPLAGANEILGTLGIIRVLAGPADTPAALPDKLMALRDLHAGRHRLDNVGAGSAELERLHEQARLAAQTRLPITLLGESGTGKQWLARAIHGHGPQRQGSFVCVDAERLPASMIGELLFEPRHRRDILGTVYLRKPAQLSRELQSRLADAVRLREDADFPRLIVGFDGDPHAEMQAGRLLAEFYFAVSPMTIAIPPLRERLAELPHFIDVFLKRTRELQPNAAQDIGVEALNALRSHGWPGNLRELLDVLRDACERAKGERIELADLPFYLKQGALPAERRLPLDTLLEQVERRLIALALKLTKNNQTRAAELLEIWRPRLLRRMEKFGINGS